MQYQLVLLCAAALLQCHTFPVLQDDTTTLRIRQTSERDNWEKNQPSILPIFKRSESTSRGSDNVEGEYTDQVTITNQDIAPSIMANGDSVQEMLTNTNVEDSTLTKERSKGRIEETATSVNNRPISFMKRSAEGGTGDGEEDCDETEGLTDGNQDENTTVGEAIDQSGREETTDEEKTDEQETDEETTDEQAVDEETTDEETTDEQAVDEETTDEQETDEETTDEQETDEEATDDPADNREGGIPEADPDCAETNSMGDTAQDDDSPTGSEGSSSQVDDQGSAVDEESSPAGEHSNDGNSDDAGTVDCSDDQEGGAGDSDINAEVEPSADYQNDQEGVDCPDDIDRVAGYQNDQSSSEYDHEGQVTRSVDYQSDQGGEDGGGNSASDADDPRATDGDEKWLQKDAEGGEDTAEEKVAVYDDQNTDGRWLGGQLADWSEYQDQDGEQSWRERRDIPGQAATTTTHPVVIPASVVQQIIRTDSNPAVSSTLVQKSAVLKKVDAPQVPVTSAMQPVPDDLKEGLKQLRQEIQHFEEKAAEIKEPPGGTVTDLGLKPVV